jgi:hypothetical protein
MPIERRLAVGALITGVIGVLIYAVSFTNGPEATKAAGFLACAFTAYTATLYLRKSTAKLRKYVGAGWIAIAVTALIPELSSTPQSAYDPNRFNSNGAGASFYFFTIAMVVAGILMIVANKNGEPSQ